MTSYRACYYLSPDQQGETVLTAPEHAHLSDDALRAEAIAEAQGAGIVLPEGVEATGDEPRLTHEALVAGLTIGDWGTI